MAGSLGRFLCPSATGRSSRDEVPAGVSGGDCMAEGVVPTEVRCPEWPEGVLVAGEGDGARDGGSETGSKQKFSMRFAWQRDFWRVEDKLRSSSSAWGLNGPSRGALPMPVRSETCWTAAAGSISWLTSLKRTDWGGSCGAEAMVDDGSVREMLLKPMSDGHNWPPSLVRNTAVQPVVCCLSGQAEASDKGRPAARPAQRAVEG